MTMWIRFARQFRREMLVHMRQPRLLMNASLFFMMIIVFFPLTLPANSSILKQIAPGLVWMAVLLASLLASERLFQQDHDDGLIEQWLVSGYALNVIVSAKMLAHWLLTIVPLLIFCPLFALLFAFTWHELLILWAVLILGTPAILSLCALAAAFGTGMQQKGILMALILLPLTIPVMIFGSGTVTAAMQGLPVSGYLAILAAMSIFAGCFLPFAIAAVIRIGLAD